MTTPARHKQRWTATDDAAILGVSHRDTLASIARQLGRSEAACSQRLYELTGQLFQRYVVSVEGMSLRETAGVLGVDKTTICGWVGAGVLRVKRTRIYKRQCLIFDPHDVLFFLYERGWLLSYFWRSEAEWSDVIEDARATMGRRYITSAALSPLIRYSPEGLAFLMRDRGMPRPVPLTRRMGAWVRHSVYQWLLERPEYATPEALRELSQAAPYDPSHCRVRGCGGPICSLTFCRKHYGQWSRYGDVELLRMV